MKKIKQLLIAFFITLSAPLIVKAADNLTIDNKSYNENTYEFKVSGTSSYSEVMVSLFDGEDLLSFKTVSTNDNKYETTFDITFEQDKTITIKVGDIDSTDYKISTLDVKKSETHLNNTLTDESGNQLIIKGQNAEFKEFERLNLSIYSQEDIEEILESVKGTPAEEEFSQIYNIIKLALGEKKLNTVIETKVEDDHGARADYNSHMSGFTLKIKIDKESYEALGKFDVAELNMETGILGDPIEYTYDEENEIIVININKLGILLAYDHVETEPEQKEENKEEKKNPNTSDTIETSFIILTISTIGLLGTRTYIKKQYN